MFYTRKKRRKKKKKEKKWDPTKFSEHGKIHYFIIIIPTELDTIIVDCDGIMLKNGQ